jgi:hypothetical protein
MYTKKEILLPPPSPKDKTKEETEHEIKADLLRFRYKTYQPNTSYKRKENDFLLQRDKSIKFDLIKKKRSRYCNAADIEFYYFTHMYLVEDYLRPSKAIAIP